MATGLGIDIGADSIKVVQARVSGSTVVITGAVKISRAGNVVLDAPTEEQAGATLVPPNLGEELKKAGLSRSGTLGISGREVVLKYLPLPPMPPQKMRMAIDMEIGGKLTGKSHAAEAPDVTYDYRLLNLPSGLRGDLMVTAGLAKNGFLYAVNDSLKAAGMSANHITPSCFGLVNAYLRTQKIQPNETVVLVDIGHELLEIAVLEEDRLYFARSAPGGGKKFTVGIDKLLKMGMQKAEEFKQQRAKIYPEGAQIPSKQDLQFQAALKEGAENIFSAIRSSIMFCRTTLKMPKLEYHRVFISGGGARLTGLREYLEKKAGKPVQVLDLSASVDLRRLDAASARCFEGEVPDMAVALGLAIIDADPKSFHFSLLPEKIIKKRVFLRKTVFGIAAAIVLMAGLYTPYLNSAASLGQADERIAFFEEKRKSAAKEKNDFVQKVEANKALSKRVDYYAKQTRVGRMYVELFSRVREFAPPDITLTSFGPVSNENSAGGGIGGGAGPMLGSVGEDGLLEFEIKGHYDTDAYPLTKFDDAWDEMRTKLKAAVPGLVDGERRVLTDAEAMSRPGVKVFQVTLKLQDPSKPVLAKAPPVDPKDGKAVEKKG